MASEGPPPTCFEKIGDEALLESLVLVFGLLDLTHATLDTCKAEVRIIHLRHAAFICCALTS